MSLFPYTRARCESSIEVLEESDNNENPVIVASTIEVLEESDNNKDPAIAASTLKDVENVSSFDIYI